MIFHKYSWWNASQWFLTKLICFDFSDNDYELRGQESPPSHDDAHEIGAFKPTVKIEKETDAIDANSRDEAADPPVRSVDASDPVIEDVLAAESAKLHSQHDDKASPNGLVVFCKSSAFLRIFYW